MKNTFILIFLIVLTSACSATKDKSDNTKNTAQMQDKHPYTNQLISESSPYLLQHAHNPVDWMPWGEEAFEKAKAENKLVLVSVGYSACHWCHVMEHESFEDTAVARIMNENFICIKVDREERPDVDQVYMNAVQLMTQRGGWPLNCFTLPDGRPIYGGTYFPQDQWINVLNSLTHTYKTEPEKVEEYAANLTEGIKQSELIEEPQAIDEFSTEKLEELILRWSQNFDNRDGGPTKAPKFPIPNNYEFLLQYGTWSNNQRINNHSLLTLDKMAMGGIYDQVGGGFSRYSTDMLWKVPHFEKMLYDNGQLVSLYSHAYQATKKDLYKETVYQTIDWLAREMTTKEGAFYAALDADSEGEEGKFYIWNQDELKETLGDDFKWVKDYYSVNGNGFWEHNNYILLRMKTDSTFANKQEWTIEELRTKVDKVNKQLLDERSHRVRPGLDDKCLTAWNAMMLKGCVDAYLAFGEEEFLQIAVKNAKWLTKNQLKEDGSLWHTYKNGKSTIDGFLEDYAHTIDAFTTLYQATFDEEYLVIAKGLTEYAVEYFQDSNSKMFYFTNSDSELIARKMEVNDNVIPASNSVMANNLWLMGTYFENETWIADSKQMLANVYEGMETYGSGYSNWANLLIRMQRPQYEIAITGKDWKAKRLEFGQKYLPNAIFMGGTKGELALLEGKFSEGETRIFVCFNKSCQLPVSEVAKAITQMK